MSFERGCTYSCYSGITDFAVLIVIEMLLMIIIEIYSIFNDATQFICACRCIYIITPFEHVVDYVLNFKKFKTKSRLM